MLKSRFDSVDSVANIFASLLRHSAFLVAFYSTCTMHIPASTISKTMGKKSKRRAAGRGRGNAFGGGSGSGPSATVSGDVVDPSAAAAASGAGAGAGTGRDSRMHSNAVVKAAAAFANMLEGIKPRESLQGIVNTNDDPLLCAGRDCSSKLDLWDCGITMRYTMLCCGKRFCPDCYPAWNERCGGCRAPRPMLVAKGMKRARSGEPWAQLTMGNFFLKTEGRPTEGMECLQSAALQGHPQAVRNLSVEYCIGELFPRDLSVARALAWKTVEVWDDPAWHRSCFELLVCVAEELAADGPDEGLHQAAAILRGIAKDVDKVNLSAKFCGRAVSILQRIESVDSDSALARFASRVFRLGIPNFLGHPSFRSTAKEACLCHLLADEPGLGMLWFSISRKLLQYASDNESQEPFMLGCWPELRNIRNACGGCGAVLEGERRKMCRRCRTYCYCSRDCQKSHWNRADGGHRGECMEVADEIRKILTAIRNGQLHQP